MKKSFKNMAPDRFYIDFYSESDGFNGEESNKTDPWYVPQIVKNHLISKEYFQIPKDTAKIGSEKFIKFP